MATCDDVSLNDEYTLTELIMTIPNAIRRKTVKRSGISMECVFCILKKEKSNLLDPEGGFYTGKNTKK